MNVLIADDESIVLNGLKHIINWNQLGFSICDTSMDGMDTLKKILELSPDLVLLDIKMPLMTGIEVIQKAVSKGYPGKFILLSGISDFKLAQTAMRYGVTFYLTKPIEEEELLKAVGSIAKLIGEETKKQSSYEHYRLKAKQEILKEILLNTCDYSSLNLDELHLNTNVYQVVSYENYNQNLFQPTWDFSDLIRVTNQDNHTFNIIENNQQKFILLKGDYALTKFKNLRRHYLNGPQKGSPLDSVFLAYGQKAARIQDIHRSYEDVCQLNKRRFFCCENQHIMGYEDILEDNFTNTIPESMAQNYAAQFSNYIQSNNLTFLTTYLKQLTTFLTHTTAEISDIKHVLIDIYILVKQNIMQRYPYEDIPFIANASVIDLLERKNYLYEIISFLAQQFKLWISCIGIPSGETIIDEVLSYIQHNYQEPIKLDTIAPLYGYTSSYLGKLLYKRTGMNFNTYLDQFRIEESKKLLTQDELKVYTIAEMVGYKNVDYFHKKFKKYTGTSPAEYRKTIIGN
ncbi:response regulator [Clostridium sp. E02]|uniref:response regulator transcription factor n=1 Tax=Clostridium sp. E02 TaxID=2487134 RepID=UPI001FAADB58|nr:response regulator [Clostridium sp. E02]